MSTIYENYKGKWINVDFRRFYQRKSALLASALSACYYAKGRHPLNDDFLIFYPCKSALLASALSACQLTPKATIPSKKIIVTG